MANRLVYLDYNAGAPLRPEVAELLSRSAQHETQEPANPSSVHTPGQHARARLNQARQQIAALVQCDAREVAFASSGTESNLWALRGAYLARAETGRRRIVTSSIEHPAVLDGLKSLAQHHGAEVLKIEPEPSGAISLQAMQAGLTSEVALCSLQWVNNETGVVQPVGSVAAHCRSVGIPFHTDAAQAIGKVPVSLSEVPADLVSFTSHKIGGPAGLGALVARTSVVPLIPGHQERGTRGGTPWVAGCEAFALALSLSVGELAAETERLTPLRDWLEREICHRVPNSRVNGTAARAPNTTNLLLPGIDAEALLVSLDLEGICVSTGAACASGSLEPSHVLLAMGLDRVQARSAIRVSMGRTTQRADLELLIDALQRWIS
jgi:cysteine desulfurase